MSEFGRLWKHKKTQHTLKSGRIISLLIVATVWKKRNWAVSLCIVCKLACLLCWVTLTHYQRREGVHILCGILISQQPKYCTNVEELEIQWLTLERKRNVAYLATFCCIINHKVCHLTSKTSPLPSPFSFSFFSFPVFKKLSIDIHFFIN